MKRSRLTRKTPLQRKTRLRPMSAKKRQEKADTDGPRRDYVEEVGCCMVCGEDDGRLQCHEIANGPDRCKAVYLRRLQAVLCDKHHREMSNKAKWPPARQLAIRLRWELRETVCTYQDVRGNRTVTIEEVKKWLSQ